MLLAVLSLAIPLNHRAVPPAEEALPVVVPVPAPPATTAQQVRPSFDAVRVDKNGQAIVAGHAAPGAEVMLHDDDTVLGSTTADATGAWVILADRPLAPGTRELDLSAHAPGAAETLLSADVVILVVPEPGREATGRTEADRAQARSLVLLVPRDHAGPGRVLQAPALPAAPVAEVEPEGDGRDAAAAAPAADAKLVVVQAGGNLWKIAQSVYGEGGRYTVIYEANRSQIHDPDLIYPGQVFMLPERPAAANRAPP